MQLLPEDMLEFLETDTGDSEQDDYSFDRGDYDEVIFASDNRGRLIVLLYLSSQQI